MKYLKRYGPVIYQISNLISISMSSYAIVYKKFRLASNNIQMRLYLKSSRYQKN